MFTLEIDGVAIAVINGSEEVANDLFTCDGFKDDIQTMKSDGKVLWNGTSPLKIRAATEEEIEIFEDALAEDDSEEDEPYEPDAHHAEASNDDEADDDGRGGCRHRVPRRHRRGRRPRFLIADPAGRPVAGDRTGRAQAAQVSAVRIASGIRRCHGGDAGMPSSFVQDTRRFMTGRAALVRIRPGGTGPSLTGRTGAMPTDATRRPEGTAGARRPPSGRASLRRGRRSGAGSVRGGSAARLGIDRGGTGSPAAWSAPARAGRGAAVLPGLCAGAAPGTAPFSADAF